MSAAFDAVEVGRTFTFGSYQFTAERIKAFAHRWDPQAFHIDEDAAKDTAFGGLIASGWHTAAAMMRLRVDYLANEGRGALPPGPSITPGVDDMKWLRPVHAGDTVTYSGTINSKRESQSRPGWAIVSMEIRGENQKGELVFSLTGHTFTAI